MQKSAWTVTWYVPLSLSGRRVSGAGAPSLPGKIFPTTSRTIRALPPRRIDGKPSKVAATIYEGRAPDKRSRGPARRSARLAHQPRAAVERRQHLVGPGRRQVEDQARDAGVAVTLDEVGILGHAEDRDRQ